MFVCNPCHSVRFGTAIDDVHLSRSRGPCELCRNPGLCADCHCKPPSGERGEAKTKALQGAAMVVDQVINPMVSLTKYVMLDEFPDLYPHEVDRALHRVKSMIVTGIDPKNNPLAETLLPAPGDIDFDRIRALIETGEARGPEQG